MWFSSQVHIFGETLTNCVGPSIISLQTQLFMNFFMALVFITIVRSRVIHYNIFHYFSAICGSIVLYYGVLGSGLFLHLSILISGYIVLHFSFKMQSLLVFDKNVNPTYVTELVCVVYLIWGEFYYPNEELWLRSRGIAMIAVMKIISMAADFRNYDTPTFGQYMGYLLCPGNSMLGPWVPYAEYSRLYSDDSKLNFKWISRIFISTILALFFLSVSNCFADQYIPDTYEWMTAYKKAICFRTSHYFVSYLAEAVMLTSGFNEKVDNPNNEWSYGITKPHYVEFPRSLATVVIYWNIPMHRFLKRYVYIVYLPYGNAVAVLFTYFFSSLLHGLNMQICLVLLSLGGFSYIQGVSQYLASKYVSACVKIRPCNNNCNHRFKYFHPITVALNFFFMVFNVVHLIYLGGVMNILSTNRSMYDTLEKWDSLGFTSHHLFFIAVSIYFLFKGGQIGDEQHQQAPDVRHYDEQYVSVIPSEPEYTEDEDDYSD